MTPHPSLVAAVDENWLQQAADRLPGAVLTRKPEWEALTLTVGGRLFGMYGADNLGRLILTMKGDPLENEALRQEFAEIVPGYYANKQHWNSVLLEHATFSAERLGEMLEESYTLVFGGLTKKLQAELRDSR